jgi:hypothetical protein
MTTFHQYDLAMRNTADETGGKPIAVWLQFTSGGEAVNPLLEDIYFIVIIDTQAHRHTRTRKLTQIYLSVD